MCPQTHSLLGQEQCSTFEDYEAVINMIIRRRSPTMKNESLTKRIALDRLFGRISLDPKIQIKYIDTRHHDADILTGSNFTRDEWNNPFRFFFLRERG